MARQPTQNSKPVLRNDLQPALEFVELPVGDIVPADRSVRKPSKKQIEKTKRSIETLGNIVPIVIGPDNKIIDGHTRLAAVHLLDLTTLPCIRLSHLDDQLMRAATIALNKIQETGSWDEDMLKLELSYQLEFNTELTSLGFDAPELDSLFEISSGTSEEADPVDEFGELPSRHAPAVAQTGDIWELGNHLLFCGNARDTETVLRLSGQRGIDMVFTDPPYNVPVNGHVRVTTDRFDEFTEASGEMTPEEFTNFIGEFLIAAIQALKPGGLVYAFMDWRHLNEMLAATDRTGLKLLNLCVWVKPNGGMGSFYRSRHELIFVCKRPGAPHKNNIELGKHGRYQTNVWEYAGATGGPTDEADDFSLHPTVKPIRLVEDAILDSTAAGEIVFDPFLGSGTTLLAAERTKRRCMGIEISPAYVDVAIRRWEALTGGEAVHQATGETFTKCASMQELAPQSELACRRATEPSTDTTMGTTTKDITEDF